MTFFYAGVVILCCAQVSYLMFFYVLFIADGNVMKFRSSFRYVKVFFYNALPCTIRAVTTPL